MHYTPMAVRARIISGMFTALAVLACNAQPRPKESATLLSPRILKGQGSSDISSVVSAHDWIAFQHTGNEDKPVYDFLIVFSTTLATPGGEFHVVAPFTQILVLSADKRDSIMTYIIDPKPSGSTSTGTVGSFQIGVYSYLALTEVHYMTPIQSKNFFGYLTSLLQKDANASEAVRKSTAYMNGFLSQVQ